MVLLCAISLTDCIASIYTIQKAFYPLPNKGVVDMVSTPQNIECREKKHALIFVHPEGWSAGKTIPNQFFADLAGHFFLERAGKSGHVCGNAHVPFFCTCHLGQNFPRGNRDT